MQKHPWSCATLSKIVTATKCNTPSWVFFTFFKLYNWYQIAQHISYNSDTSLFMEGLITKNSQN